MFINVNNYIRSVFTYDVYQQVYNGKSEKYGKNAK